MKAAVLEKLNAPLKVLGLRFQDSGLKPGQVLVRMACAGICGAQLKEINGEKGDPAHLPHLLGHEGCGIVEETGPGVTHVKKVDKIVIHWRKGAGAESELPYYIGPAYGPPRKVEGAGYIVRSGPVIKSGPCTTFSEYTIVSENRCTKIPDGVPDDFAALLGCALSTALATIENETKWGQSILVIGCGGVGLSFGLAARANHLGPIFAFDKNTAALNTAETLGARTLYPAIDGYDFDLVVDTTGNQEAIAIGMSALRPSGKFIMVGQPKSDSSFIIHHSSLNMFAGEGKKIIAVQAGGFNPTHDIPRYVSMWREGALDDYSKIIGHRIKLDQINEGIALMQNGQAIGRVMIDF